MTDKRPWHPSKAADKQVTLEIGNLWYPGNESQTLPQAMPAHDGKGK